MLGRILVHIGRCWLCPGNLTGIPLAGPIVTTCGEEEEEEEEEECVEPAEDAADEEEVPLPKLTTFPWFPYTG